PLWPHMTVAQNVAYGLRFNGVPRTEREGKVAEMLRVVQLAGYEQRYPGELSGGQQQRVAVARALVVEPEILLLDEPLSNLDASLREEMRFEIRRLHETFGITTLYVTHDQSEAMVLSDRVAVLDQGRVARPALEHGRERAPRHRAARELSRRCRGLSGPARRRRSRPPRGGAHHAPVPPRGRRRPDRAAVLRGQALSSRTARAARSSPRRTRRRTPP